MAYQGVDEVASTGQRDFDEVFGLSVGTTFAGADVRVAYASEPDRRRELLRHRGQLPFGPVTATAYYVVRNRNRIDDNYGISVDYSEARLS